MADNFDSNPPRTVEFSSFPDYAGLSEKYKPENLEKLYKEQNNNTTIDEFLSQHAKGAEDLAAKKQLFYKLYAMQQEEKEDPSRNDISTTIGFGGNDELCLVMRCKNEYMGDFGLVVRDGKLTFSAADLTSEQVQAAYYFLYMRGLASSLVIPENLAPELKTNLASAETALGEFNNNNRVEEENLPGGTCTGEGILNKEGITGNEFDDWLVNAWNEAEARKKQEAELAAHKKASKRFGLKEANAELEEWGDVQGEVRGLNYFHIREKGGWHVWAAYKEMNINNVFDEVKKDKDGNLRAQFRYKIYVREKNGQLQIGYAVPPGGKLEKDQAEVMCKIASKAGYSGIHFHGTQELDYYTIRKACAKELLIPKGISLKPDGALAMIEAARGYHPQGKKVANFERMLVEQIKDNAQAAGREMNDSEKKLYEDVYVRSNLANFRPLYAGALKGKLEELSKDGVKAEIIIGASNFVADFYIAYRDEVARGVKDKEGQQSTVPTLMNVLTSRVVENVNGEKVERPLMKPEEIKTLQNLINNLPDHQKHLKINITKATMPSLDPVHMDLIYKVMIDRYSEQATSLLNEAYKNGSVTDSEQKIAGNALRSVMGRLSKEVASDFRANVDLDGIKPLANHSIILPAIDSISNPYYVPSKEAKEIRTERIKERNKGLSNPNLPGGHSPRQ
ncbi:MAG: hypothetical protein LBR70_03010 [Lactobacillaceae bacterium]|jgi:hypothetical protein|nr:hypothetical protein [Lactobacillaceae bacterium]